MKNKLVMLALVSAIVAMSSISARADDAPKTKQPTKADTNREVVRTYVQFYLKQKNYFEAERMINEYMVQDQGDGALWNMLGLAQMEQKKFSQACYAFKKASDTFTVANEKTTALYNFADCLHRGGRNPEAEIVLNQIASIDPGSAAAMQNMIDWLHNGRLRPGQAFPRQGAKARNNLRFSGAIGFGYDTNVLLVDDQLISSTPASTRASPYVTPAFQLGYLTSAFGTDLDTRYIASFTDYTSTAAKSFNSLYQRGDFIFGRNTNRVGIFGEAFMMNRDPFQMYFWDVGGTWYHAISSAENSAWDLEVPLRYQRYPLDYNSTSTNIRTGEDLQVKASYREAMGGSGYLVSQFVLDNQYSTGSNYRLVGIIVPATLAHSFPFFEKWGMLNTFTAEVTGQYYYNSDPKRRDYSGKLGAGLVKKIAEGWNASFDVAYMKNYSSIEAARYSKATVSLFFSHDFL